MIYLPTILIAMLLMVLVLASYVDRLYSEMGKFLAREFQENIDAWERLVEPRMGMRRERIALSAAIVAELSLALLTLVFGMLLFDRRVGGGEPSAAEIAQAFLGIVLVVVLFNRLLPFVFFTRTKGRWIARWRLPLQLLFVLVLPVTLLLGFLLSIASFAEAPPQHEEEGDAEAVEALIEAGQEEGILEESDRDLVRSAVEFGDKVVREVMTPRPEIFAVPAGMTLENFLVESQTRPYSRVPVYVDMLDNVTGVLLTHDLLQVSDEEARTRTVASIQRPVSFVPETKRVNELLREMQREKQHMQIVIDEYGGVAGVVTIEDLLEELVGAIKDEHDGDDESAAIVREGAAVWAIPGSLEVKRLEGLLSREDALPPGTEATTVSGLVIEIAGRIPMTGEVVESNGLRFEILASTDRRIERLRVSQQAQGGD